MSDMRFGICMSYQDRQRQLEGKQAGADLLIFGSVNMKPEMLAGKTLKEYSVNIRLTDIATGVEVMRTRYKVSKYSERSGYGW